MLAIASEGDILKMSISFSISPTKLVGIDERNFPVWRKSRLPRTRSDTVERFSRHRRAVWLLAELFNARHQTFDATKSCSALGALAPFTYTSDDQRPTRTTTTTTATTQKGTRTEGATRKRVFSQRALELLLFSVLQKCGVVIK